MTKRDLRRVGDLDEKHMGKPVTVTIAGAPVTGTLAGTLPLRDQVRLVLIVGASGARMFTPALSVDDVVEVERRKAS